MTRFRLIFAGLLITGWIVIQPQAALADDCPTEGGASSTGDSATAKLGNCHGIDPPADDKQRAADKGGKSVKLACVWVPEPSYQPGPGQKAGGDGGGWYRKFCSFGKYNTLADFEQEMSGWDAMNMRQSNMMRRAGLDIRWFATPPPQERRTPLQVMQSVVDEIPFPKTFIAVNPVASKQVVRVPTWVWLTDEKGQFVPDRYDQKTKTIELEGYQLRWQIVPELTVSPGAGGQDQSCEGPGMPWSASTEGDQSACTVTYQKAGQYTLSASVGWTVQWWLEDEAQEDIDGPTNTATRAVTVLEVQAMGR